MFSVAGKQKLSFGGVRSSLWLCNELSQNTICVCLEEGKSQLVVRTIVPMNLLPAVCLGVLSLLYFILLYCIMLRYYVLCVSWSQLLPVPTSFVRLVLLPLQTARTGMILVSLLLIIIYIYIYIFLKKRSCMYACFLVPWQFLIFLDKKKKEKICCC